MTLIRVTDKLYRGSRPNFLSDFKRLKASGITTIISLQGNLIEVVRESIEEDCDLFDGKVLYFPMSSVTPPTPEQVRRVWAAIEDAKGPVFVHCQDGVDRTGFVVAAFQIHYLGYSFFRAYRFMRKCGFHMTTYFWWLPFLFRYC